MKITKYAIYNPLATSAILLGLLVLGIYGLMRLSVDFLPDVTYPMIKVHIWWRGATPEEIDKNIADPIERQMATVDNLDYLESSSIEGMYTLFVNFNYGVNIDSAYQDALAAMARLTRELLKDIDPPIVIKADPSQLPVAKLTIQSAKCNLVKLREWTDDNWLQDQLLAVPGVAGTEIIGGLKREIRINLDSGALEKYVLTLSDVLNRLKKENVEQFRGRIITGRREFIARTMGEFTDIEEISSTVLARKKQAQVLVRNIAEVTDAHEEVRVITRFNGQTCVELSILKQSDANTVKVAKVVENITRWRALRKDLDEKNASFQGHRK